MQTRIIKPPFQLFFYIIFGKSTRYGTNPHLGVTALGNKLPPVGFEPSALQVNSTQKAQSVPD